MRIRCPAKLNLFLRVAAGTDRHPLVSAMAALDFGDDLTAERSAGRGLSLARRWAPDAPSPSPLDWPAEADLAWAAAEAFAAAGATPPDVALDLVKRVPCGGGLGGGSADAAGVLVAMDRLWPGRVSAEALRGLAAGLGSDVAFALAALRGEPLALVSGTGERVSPLSPPPAAAAGAGGLHAALVFPPFGCPTGAVFAALDARLAAGEAAELPSERDVRVAAASGWPSLADLGNNLAGPACDVRPALGRAMTALRAAGLAARVTGSGSTLFVLADDAAAARTAAERARAVLGFPAVAVALRPVDPPSQG